MLLNSADRCASSLEYLRQRLPLRLCRHDLVDAPNRFHLVPPSTKKSPGGMNPMPLQETRMRPAVYRLLRINIEADGSSPR